MKKKICLLLFLFISLSSSAQENDKNSILKVLEDQRQAWNKGDPLSTVS